MLLRRLLPITIAILALATLSNAQQRPLITEDVDIIPPGTLRIEADTKISVAERLVNFSEFSITASNFPTLSREQFNALGPFSCIWITK